MLLGELRKMMMKAKLEKDTVKGNLLSTLVAEAVMVGKNDGNRETTDAETIAMIKIFLANGFAMKSAYILDLFPDTPHFETVVMLSRA